MRQRHPLKTSEDESESDLILKKWTSKSFTPESTGRPHVFEFVAYETLQELKNDPLKVIREIGWWSEATTTLVCVLISGQLDSEKRESDVEVDPDVLNEKLNFLLHPCELYAKRLATWCDSAVGIIDPTPLLRLYEQLNACVWKQVIKNEPVYTEYFSNPADQDWEGNFWFACEFPQLRASFGEARLAAERMRTFAELRYVQEHVGKPPTEETLASKWDIAETLCLEFPRAWRQMEKLSKDWGKPFTKGKGRSHDRWNWLDPGLRRTLQTQFYRQSIPLELKKATRSPYSKKASSKNR